ncbi:ribonuclease III [Allosphingosinicella flava]|uniref:Ribonuclease 3 n=1 Tax=Allosphingosinicella flava TaxID=2771430 RepID=A0A7T2GLQ3_9SPHN|nr:ribonuclease III [Sphingosinicella flava]QPQ56127.1 ribonuclease III [Sphingosinicella flava]
MSGAVIAWVEAATGHKPKDPALFIRALTHSSRGGDHYERLEFLGDRVLGLVVADWIYRLFPTEPEGVLSRRLNVLVSRETCADVGRQLGVGAQAILGKQAREDGATESDNVLGDIVEALIGALYLEGGLPLAAGFIRTAWGDRAERHGKAPKHPKSALQEWAAANNKRPPVYEMKGRTGAHHAPRFVVAVAIKGVGEAEAEGTSKQEAETAAAKALLEKVS